MLTVPFAGNKREHKKIIRITSIRGRASGHTHTRLPTDSSAGSSPPYTTKLSTQELPDDRSDVRVELLRPCEVAQDLAANPPQTEMPMLLPVSQLADCVTI